MTWVAIAAAWAAFDLVRWWWTRTVVDDRGLFVHSMVRISRRVDRAAVTDVTQHSVFRRGLAWSAWTLAVRTTGEDIALRVPMTEVAPGTDDPEYYRIWAWLRQALVPAGTGLEPAARTPAADRVDGAISGSHPSVDGLTRR
jgi:hypothetical protein